MTKEEISKLINELEFELEYAETFVDVKDSYDSLFNAISEIVERLKEKKNGNGN